MNKNVENNLYNMYNITQIFILDGHFPGPKQEVGNRNSSLLLQIYCSLPVMHFAKLNKPPSECSIV